jgi:hypothetical protein
MSNPYRKIEQRQKILNHLLYLESQAELIQGWQNPGSDLINNRNFMTLGIDKVIPEKNMYISTVLQGNPQISEHLNDQLYMRELNDSWAYKSMIKAVASDKLALTLPEELLLIEKRLYDRFHVPKHIVVELLCSIKIQNKRKLFKFPIQDISSGGLRLNIPNTALTYFANHESLKIHQIGKINVKNKEAFIVRKSDFSLSHIYRPSEVGLMFKEPLERVLLSPFERLEKFSAA